MGNVQNRGKTDQLTKFQREKLKYDFYTFFGKLATSMHDILYIFSYLFHFKTLFQNLLM